MMTMDPNVTWTQIVEGAQKILERSIGLAEPGENRGAVEYRDRTAELGEVLAEHIANLCEWLNKGGFPPDVLVPRAEAGPLQGIDVIARLTAVIEPMQADPNAKLAALAYLFEQTARRAGLNVAQAVDLLCTAWARGESLNKKSGS
jgi:hypothetical protein